MRGLFMWDGSAQAWSRLRCSRERQSQQSTVPLNPAARGEAMIARVLRVNVPPEGVDAVLDAYREDVRPIHVQAVGLRQHYVLVDRVAGRIEIIGVWDSADDVRAIAPKLEPARQRLWTRFGADPRSKSSRSPTSFIRQIEQEGRLGPRGARTVARTDLGIYFSPSHAVMKACCANARSCCYAATDADKTRRVCWPVPRTAIATSSSPPASERRSSRGIFAGRG